MDIVLKPSDIIIVKQQSGYSRQRSVYVDGMVINPGRYVLKRSGDKVADIIKRVGGFTSNADSSTTTMTLPVFSSTNSSIVIKSLTNDNESMLLILLSKAVSDELEI